MPTSRANDVIQHLRRAVLLQDAAGLTDGQLLRDYVVRRDEAALAALVRRHGPTVWGVCRRVLSNYHDAEDAFQATFLVLVRKAASIACPELIANWLYGVAHQTARKARATTARRGARERQVTEMPERAMSRKDLWKDLRPVLDQALSGLPDKYRSAIVLCDLEGKTRKEAARQLGVPDGTLAARLARGRGILAARLARHGLPVLGGSLAAVLAQNTATAKVPALVAFETIRAASLFAAGPVASDVLSARSIALTKGILKTMLITKIKIATAVVSGLALLGIGWHVFPTRAAAPPDGQLQAALAPVFAVAEPAKQVGKSGKHGPAKRKVSLPIGPPPVQVVVNLTKDGALLVKTSNLLGFGAAPPQPAGAPFTAPGLRKVGGIGLVPPQGTIQSHYDLDEVQIVDTAGKKISKKELAKLLQEETVAVASFGGRQLDPLHLRILKEGTLVFILPIPRAGALPFPGADHTVPPGLRQPDATFPPDANRPDLEFGE